jgi:hypothetical protein
MKDRLDRLKEADDGESLRLALREFPPSGSDTSSLFYIIRILGPVIEYADKIREEKGQFSPDIENILQVSQDYINRVFEELGRRK